MIPNHVAENVLGTIGTILWTGQLIPQVWKSYRQKSTEGLSHWLVLLWGISSAFLGVYTIVQNLNIPLIVQPQLFGFLALVSWAQCQYYEKKRSRRVASLMALTVMILVGSFEAGMVFAVLPSFHRGDQRPVQFFGIASSVLISIALFPQYYEIAKRKEVVGISITFMAIDMLGGVFSVLSLVFKEKFDVIASITYLLVVVLDGFVIIAAVILNPRAKKRRRRELEAAEAAFASTPSMTEVGGTRGVTPSTMIETRANSSDLERGPKATEAGVLEPTQGGKEA